MVGGWRTPLARDRVIIPCGCGMRELVDCSLPWRDIPIRSRRWHGRWMGSAWPRGLTTRPRGCGRPERVDCSSPWKGIRTRSHRWHGRRTGSAWPRRMTIQRGCGSQIPAVCSSPWKGIRMGSHRWRGRRMGSAWPRGLMTVPRGCGKLARAGCSSPFRGICKSVTSVAWTTDGERLATGSWDHTARVWDARSGRELAALLHTPAGGVAFSGSYVSAPRDADLTALTVRTGAACAPLALYADVCLRPDLVAAALAGELVPSLHVPMDTAERVVAGSALVPASPADLSPPDGQTGAALREAVRAAQRTGDKAFFERTLQALRRAHRRFTPCRRRSRHPFAGRFPDEPQPSRASGRKATVLPAGEIEERPLTLNVAGEVRLPPSRPGRVMVTFKLALYEAERVLSLPVTAFARNPYIVGAPIEDPAISTAGPASSTACSRPWRRDPS